MHNNRRVHKKNSCGEIYSGVLTSNDNKCYSTLTKRLRRKIRKHFEGPNPEKTHVYVLG